ncbi:MAG: hypothetical protein AAF334_10655 [Pseudomonadota bacterium]
MITREVQLHTGLKIGDDQVTVAVIREETLGDELDALEAGHDGVKAHRKIMMARVIRLGTLDHPQEAVLKKLSRTDWELIERDLQTLDLDLAKAAGLLDDNGEPVERGRSQPGGEAPGDV